MNIRRQLILDKHLHDVDYNNGHELNEAIIAAMEEYAQEQLKNCNLQSVSNNIVAVCTGDKKKFSCVEDGLQTGCNGCGFMKLVQTDC